MRFIGLKSCDTCRKSLRALKDAGFNIEVTDVRADGLDDLLIEQITAAFGDAAVNRSSATWRGLSSIEKALPPGVLIAKYPTIMKRPVIHANGEWYQGWREDVSAVFIK